MRPTRGAVRYHVPRDRSPVPAVLVGALVVVTLVAAQLSIAAQPRREALGGTAAASASELEPGASRPPAAPPVGEGASAAPPSPTEDGTPAGGTDGVAGSGTDSGTDSDPDGLPQPVELTFAVGEDAPSGDAVGLLGPVVETLLADPTTRVRVVGHAETSNDPVLEEQLSLRRAETVLDLLVDRGISASRADVVGAGAREAGGSQSGTDRRVVVEVVQD